MTSIPERYYVSKRRTPWESEPDLAFLTFQELTASGEPTVSCRKRLETMRSWCGHPRGEDVLDHVDVFDNVPTEGFRLLEVVSRRSTDNKVFRIRDPRGFVAEIYSRNLTDIAMEAGIVRGEFQGEYVWARCGGNYLLSTSSSEFKDLKRREESKASWTRPEAGDLVEIYGQKMAYLGNIYKVEVKRVSREIDSWGRGIKATIEVSVDEKPWNVLVFFNDGNLYFRNFTLLRRFTSNHLVVGRVETDLDASMVGPKSWEVARYFPSLEDLRRFIFSGGKRVLIDEYRAKNGGYRSIDVVG